MRSPQRRWQQQRGAALLVVLGLLITVGIGTLLVFAAPQPISGEWDIVTQDALSQARNALIGRAASNENRPGSLPCPDTNNDGVAELFAGTACPEYVGRLPWRTLGLPELRDSSGELLWYSLSPSLRDHVSAQPINSVDTPIEISVTGTLPTTYVAAVIIAPGRALAGQTRDAAGINNISNYLEGDNATPGDNSYTTALNSATFNDRVNVITREQLFDVVEWRVAAEIRTALQRYFVSFQFFPFANDYSDNTYACTNGTMRGRVPNADLSTFYPLSGTCPLHADWLPNLTPRTSPPSWFSANGWHRITYYAVAPACTRPTLNCSGVGFLAVNGKTNVGAVIIVGGRALGTQVRPCGAASDCIEQPMAATDIYQAQQRILTFNDRVLFVSP